MMPGPQLPDPKTEQGKSQLAFSMLTCSQQIDSKIFAYMKHIRPRRALILDQQKQTVGMFPLFVHDGTRRGAAPRCAHGNAAEPGDHGDLLGARRVDSSRRGGSVRHPPIRTWQRLDAGFRPLNARVAGCSRRAGGCVIVDRRERAIHCHHVFRLTRQEGGVPAGRRVVCRRSGGTRRQASPRSAARFSDPAQVLGPPNVDNATNQKTPESMTLGCAGTLTLRFSDNALVDVPGADLYVFEVGPAVEATSLSISPDGEAWTEVGTIRGGTAEVDIAKVAAPGASYRYVRLTDLKRSCGGPWPGADVDAVGAIGSTLALSFDASVLFDVDMSVLKPQARTALLEAASTLARYEGAGHYRRRAHRQHGNSGLQRRVVAAPRGIGARIPGTAARVEGAPNRRARFRRRAPGRAQRLRVQPAAKSTGRNRGGPSALTPIAGLPGTPLASFNPE